MREYLLRKFAEHLLLGDNVLINGDLFDTYQIPMIDLLKTHQIICAWLSQKITRRICLVPGNHCLSKASHNLSSFELMSRLLQGQFGEQVKYAQGGVWAQDGVYVISHVPNQELFDLEIDRVPDGVKFLMLHANFDSVFACAADHSINLSREQAKKLKARGITMVLGHEHQGRELMGGKVVIAGNQVPSSVSDCLSHGDAQKGGTKRATLLNPDDGTYQFVTTWTPDDAEGWYATIDWRELKDVQEEGRGFIRVEGAALAAEASDVIKAISSFRQRSKSFVVTNAVKVEQVEGLSDIADSIEDVRGVNVVELLLEMLDPKQKLAVQALYEMEST